MATALLAQGDALFIDEDYTGAIKLYTEAAEADPTNARVLAQRAQAHIKLEDYMPALEDAGKAVHLDPTLAVAHMRHGIALFNLDEFEGAKQAFEAGALLAPETVAYRTWARKCQAELDDETETAPPKTAKPAAAAPPASPPAAAPAAQSPTAPANGHPAAAAAAAPAAASSEPAAAAAAATSATAYLPDGVPYGMPAVQEGKYRHQWYQLQSKVTVDVYAKKLGKDRVTCSFGDGDRLTLVVRDAAGEEEYTLDVELFSKVVPEKCKCEVLGSKVEITLIKVSDTPWATLEKSSQLAAFTPAAPTATASGEPRPGHKKSAKDWDKVGSDLAEQAKKGELDEGDPLNNFFKKIFSQGDEDQQRAMKKSFLESNGTVLSTNWDEVGKKEVVCTPPEGMEVRKYNE